MNRRQLFKWTGLSAVAGLIGGGSWFAFHEPKNTYYSGPTSDHFNGTNFFNPKGTAPRKLSEVLKWQMSGGKAKWPESYPSAFDGNKPEAKVEGSKIKVTMVGHATLLIQTQGLNFITDPVFANRASPVQFAGPKRVNPPGIRFEDLPDIDYVLLSHNHYDHLDIESLSRLVNEKQAKIITPLGNDTIIKAKVPNSEFVTGDWGDFEGLKNKCRIHFEPCHHWSARGVNDRRMALWAAFVIETPSAKIYHVGDTGYHDGINYRALLEKHGPMDLAILPIGAYEPRWFMKGQHQNPDEAVLGAMAIEAKTTIGHHCGTFQLTNEAIEAPIEALQVAKAKYNINDDAFVVLRPGEEWS